MKTLEVKGFTVLVEYKSDNYESPWDNCDGHGKVRKSTYRHGEYSTDKKPGERPMNKADRNEYQFYYDWQAAMKTAKRDGWNAEPYDAPNRAERAVKNDFDFLSGWINRDWEYVIVTVILLDDDGEEITSDSLGMVGTYKDYHETQAVSMANDLVENHIEDLLKEELQTRINSRYHDAQNLGVTA